jgi:hypothetical protein
LLALLAGVTVLGGGVFAAPGISAAGSAQTTTEHTHKETVVFYDYVPCMEELGAYRITAVVNAVEHGTEKGSTAHFTFTETGSFEAVGVDAVLEFDEENDEQVPVPADPAVDASKPTFTGQYTVWGGFNGNQKNEASTFTFSVHATGSDGSVVRMHNVFHASLSATGIENVFEKGHRN